jgi:twitching motility two-component system response regulator PilH
MSAPDIAHREVLMTIKKILIVDDSPTERHYLSEILVKGGFDVVTSDSGEDALIKAKTLQPDLIMMDLVMPGMNGFQATRAITRDEATKNIPVLICTTKGQESDRIWGLRQGARDYMVKPILSEALLKRIETMGGN